MNKRILILLLISLFYYFPFLLSSRSTIFCPYDFFLSVKIINVQTFFIYFNTKSISSQGNFVIFVSYI